MTAMEKVAKLQKLWSRIVSSEAYLVDARGSDRRAELRQLKGLRREYSELREQPIDGIPATTGEAGLLAGAVA